MQVTTRGLRPVLRLWSSSWEEIKAVVNSVLLVDSVVLARLGAGGVGKGFTLRQFQLLGRMLAPC